MKATYAAAVVIAAIGLVGCSTTKVRTDYDQRSSFHELRTYQWLDKRVGTARNPAINSQLLQTRIQKAVDIELLRLGFEKASSREPDFLITYHVVANEKYDVSIDDDYGYYGYGRFGHHRPYYGSTIYTDEYLEGTLILDIIDAKTNKLIWRGWATKTLDNNPKPEKVQMYVNKAVRKILEQFPPTS